MRCGLTRRCRKLDPLRSAGKFVDRGLIFAGNHRCNLCSDCIVTRQSNKSFQGNSSGLSLTERLCCGRNDYARACCRCPRLSGTDSASCASYQHRYVAWIAKSQAGRRGRQQNTLNGFVSNWQLLLIANTHGKSTKWRTGSLPQTYDGRVKMFGYNKQRVCTHAYGAVG